MGSRSWGFELVVTAGLTLSTGSTFATESAAPAAAPGCANLLVLSLEDRPALTPEAVREISDRLWMEKVNGRSQFIENMKLVTEDLVTAGNITRAQADSQFAERVLGEFSPIFSKYVIAELKARDFDDAQIIEFIIHFKDAYGAQAQIDFALAVTRRMLVTVNDAVAATSPRGLEQFLKMVEAFGVTGKAYSQFLDVWSHVRTAHPRTVIQFILLNIKNAGDIITAAARAQVDEEIPTAPPTRSWLAWLTEVAAPVPKKTLHAVAYDLLGRLEVPQSLLEVEGLFVDENEAPGVLFRLMNKGESNEVHDFIARLEVVPPYAWDFLVGNQTAYWSHAQLAVLRHSSIFKKLTAATQSHVEEALRRFDGMRAALMDAYTTLRDEQGARAPQPDPDSGGSPRSERVARFMTHVNDEYRSWRERDERPSAGDISTMLVTAFNQCASQLGPMTPGEFMSMTRMLIAQIFPQPKRKEPAAVAQTLLSLSREFVLTDRDGEEIIALIKAHEYPEPGYSGRYDLMSQGVAPGIEKARNWGRRGGDSVPSIRPFEASPRLREKLATLRAALPADEMIEYGDEDLFYLVQNYQP